jgi:hypothetical protein
MKILLALGLSTALFVGCGRKRVGEKGINFPTYEQIRGERIYTNDIVVPQNSSNDMLPRTSRSSERIVSKYFGAFDFPADSVTYIVNGRQAKDQKSAEKEVKAYAAKIERVSISEADGNGKRFVEIDYSEKMNANEQVVP